MCIAGIVFGIAGPTLPLLPTFENNNTIPKLVQPGDLVEVKIDYLVRSIKNRWTTTSPIKIKTIPFSTKNGDMVEWKVKEITSQEDYWEDRLYEFRRGTAGSKIWVKFLLPSDLRLAGQSLQANVQFSIKYAYPTGEKDISKDKYTFTNRYLHYDELVKFKVVSKREKEEEKRRETLEWFWFIPASISAFILFYLYSALKEKW